PPGDEDHVVEPERAEALEPIARDLGRTREIARIVRSVGTGGRTVEVDLDVGDDGALAAEVAEPRDPVAQRPPARARAGADPAIAVSSRTPDTTHTCPG